MRRNKVLLIAAALTFTPSLLLAAVNIPFGSHSFTYAAHIKPNTETQAQIDDRVRTFYNNWKTAYLQQKCVASPAHYRINYGGDQTVSEAHGYGMLITVLMAGHDASAQAIFDGMYWYYRAHPATAPAASRLLAWKQDSACNNIEGASTASDGDLDVAMALVMADRQWGSCGAINYRGEANLMIAQIKQYDLNSTWKYVKLGNWATSGNYLNSTRSSDFMPGHYRSFQWSTGDAIWSGLIDHTYYLVTATAHATTGLLPDFIASPLSAPYPAPPNFLEDSGDGNYDYNACRDPWRLGTDYLATGDVRALAAIQKIAAWTKGAPINSAPANVRAGYTLPGAATASWNDFSFTGPFTVGAMGDAGNQALLNNFWAHIRGAATVNYYGDSIKLLCMIVVSGNWWQPEAMPDPCAAGTPTATRTRTMTSTPTRTRTPTATPTRTRTQTATGTATRTPTATSTFSAAATFTFTLSSSPTRSATPSATASRTSSQTATLTGTQTASPTATRTQTPTASRTATATFSPTGTATRTASQTATLTSTGTRTASASVTATETEAPAGSSPTSTPTVSPSITHSPTSSASPTASSTATRTATSSPSATGTASPTSTPSATSSNSPTQTATPTRTQTATATVPLTGTRTATPTSTPPATASPTATMSASPSSTPSAVASASPSPSVSMTASPSPSPSATGTLAQSVTASATPTATASFTATQTASPSPVGSPTHSPTQTSSPTPSMVVSATPGTGGPLKIESVMPMPNPNPTIFYVKLSGWAEQIELRIYSIGYHLIQTQVSGPHYPGWTIVYLPADFLANASNGTYFYTMLAKSNSGAQSKAYKGKFAIYR